EHVHPVSIDQILYVVFDHLKAGVAHRTAMQCGFGAEYALERTSPRRHDEKLFDVLILGFPEWRKCFDHAVVIGIDKAIVDRNDLLQVFDVLRLGFFALGDRLTRDPGILKQLFLRVVRIQKAGKRNLAFRIAKCIDRWLVVQDIVPSRRDRRTAQNNYGVRVGCSGRRRQTCNVFVGNVEHDGYSYDVRLETAEQVFELRKTLFDAVTIEINDLYFVRAGGGPVDVRSETKDSVRESKKASQFCRPYRLNFVAKIWRDDKYNFARGHFRPS